MGTAFAAGWTPWLRCHGLCIDVVGRAVMVVVGILFVTGAWRSLLIPSSARWPGWAGPRSDGAAPVEVGAQASAWRSSRR